MNVLDMLVLRTCSCAREDVRVSASLTMHARLEACLTVISTNDGPTTAGNEPQSCRQQRLGEQGGQGGNGLGPRVWGLESGSKVWGLGV